jgi:RHS repeat-associated protein
VIRCEGVDLGTPRHYNYFRDYDSAIGRNVESDPSGLRGGINTYGYVGGSPLALVDPAGLEPNCAPEDRCAQLRKQIFAKAATLVFQLGEYDPVKDGQGGFAMLWGSGTTTPGGHYQKINNLQQGLKNDIAEYKRLCSNNGGWPPVPMRQPTKTLQHR